MRRMLGTALFLILALTLAAASHGTETRKTPVVLAVEEAGSSVVNISTERVVRRSTPFGHVGDPLFDQFFRDFFDAPRARRYTRTSLGSGVIIRKDGYILTNEHVILRASKITVTLLDGREFEADVVGSDSSSDLAILKIQAASLPAIRIGKSSDLMIGETVIAIGNPFGLSHTVTTGVVSAVHRSFRADEKRIFSDFIQTDASINPGNSGGPLLNLVGELIGINTAIHGKAQGIGFAIPVDRALRIVDNLIRFGRVQHGWVGLRVADLTAQTAEATDLRPGQGVYVKHVFADSPAAQQGLRKGDVIEKIGQTPTGTLYQYRSAIMSVTLGDTITLAALRKGKRFEVALTATELPTSAAKAFAWHLLGIGVVPNSPSVARSYNLATVKGLVITKVRLKSPAGQVGIQPGDVLLVVGGQTITTEKQFHQACASLRLAQSAIIVVQRSSRAYYLSLHLD